MVGAELYIDAGGASGGYLSARSLAEVVIHSRELALARASFGSGLAFHLGSYVGTGIGSSCGTGASNARLIDCTGSCIDSRRGIAFSTACSTAFNTGRLLDGRQRPIQRGARCRRSLGPRLLRRRVRPRLAARGLAALRCLGRKRRLLARRLHLLASLLAPPLGLDVDGALLPQQLAPRLALLRVVEAARGAAEAQALLLRALPPLAAIGARVALPIAALAALAHLRWRCHGGGEARGGRAEPKLDAHLRLVDGPLQRVARLSAAPVLLDHDCRLAHHHARLVEAARTAAEAEAFFGLLRTIGRRCKGDGAATAVRRLRVKGRVARRRAAESHTLLAALLVGVRTTHVAASARAASRRRCRPARDSLLGEPLAKGVVHLGDGHATSEGLVLRLLASPRRLQPHRRPMTPLGSLGILATASAAAPAAPAIVVAVATVAVLIAVVAAVVHHAGEAAVEADLLHLPPGVHAADPIEGRALLEGALGDRQVEAPQEARILGGVDARGPDVGELEKAIAEGHLGQAGLAVAVLRPVVSDRLLGVLGVPRVEQQLVRPFVEPLVAVAREHPLTIDDLCVGRREASVLDHLPEGLKHLNHEDVVAQLAALNQLLLGHEVGVALLPDGDCVEGLSRVDDGDHLARLELVEVVEMALVMARVQVAHLSRHV